MLLKDAPTFSSEGKLLKSLIDGVVVHQLQPVVDRRGEVMEVYRPSWDIHPDPLVFVYQIRISPNATKGWVVHEKQDDRLFNCTGVLRWALFDNREDSPTYKMINDLTFTERTPSLLIIPKGVFHAVKNIGTTEAIFMNMPTRPYDHQDPDKYRLPLKNNLIPFDFEDGSGW